MKKIINFLIIIITLSLITPAIKVKASGDLDIQSFIVKTNDPSRTQSIINKLGITNFKKVDAINIYEINTSEGDVSNIKNIFAQDSSTVYVEDNKKTKISEIPNDPLFIYQSYLQNSNIVNAWDLSSDSNDIIVAVIDTGVNYKHEDLKDKIWTNTYGYHGFDFVNNSNETLDDNGHGTMIAGIIGAKRNNGLGIAGIANVKIMSVKAVPASGEGDVADLAKGIIYAADNGARIANVSLGLAEESATLDNAITYAKNKNCLVVAATGNMYRSFIDNPARNSLAIGVTAVNGGDIRASYANYGTGTSITAAGNNIYSTSWDPSNTLNFYEAANGTSFATPQVTATAALLLAKDSSLTPAQLKKRILSSAKKLPAMFGSVYNEEYGYGKLDATAALQYDTLPPTTNLNIYQNSYGTFDIKGTVIDSKTSVSVLADTPDSNIGLVRYQTDSSQTWTTLNTNAAASLNINFSLGFLELGNHTIILEASDTAGNKKTVLLNTRDALIAPASNNLSDYKYTLVEQSPYVNSAPGETLNMTLVYQNTGNTAWNKNMVRLGTVGPTDRASIFTNQTWLSPNRIAMQEDLVPVGGLAHFNFTITCPNGVYGKFNEYFNLVADGIGWMKDIGLFWKVSLETPSYHALFIDQSPYITMNRGEERQFWVDYKNSGSAIWSSGNVSLGTNKPQDRGSVFFDSVTNSGWKSNNRIGMSENEAKPGETVRFNFNVKAPDTVGTFYENFRPVADGVTWMEDFGLFWKIIVQ